MIMLQNNNKGRESSMFKKISPWLFGLYCFLCIAPFLIPGLNRIEPMVFGIPFTVWYVFVLAFLCCLLIKYLSVHVWKGYDREEEQGGAN